MTIELQAVTFCSLDPQRDAEFWGAVLNRPLVTDGDEILLAGGSGQLGLRFASGTPHGLEKNRLHLHLADGPLNQEDTIAMCVARGARLLGSGHVPENSYAHMADPVEDEFCVIEDGNSYLAGCGPLAEVTCDGTRSVGHFWSAALGWPLVWDEGEETAIQSPAGGTKISWSGDAVNPNIDPHRQHFALTVHSDQLTDEVRRLLDLGASVPAIGRTGETVLLDPDGNKLVIRTS